MWESNHSSLHEIPMAPNGTLKSFKNFSLSAEFSFYFFSEYFTFVFDNSGISELKFPFRIG